MKIADKINITMRISTHEALKNLFGILDVPGATFDEQLFELATRAFSAYSDVHKEDTLDGPARKTLVKRGTHKDPRRRIDMRAATYTELRDLHNRLFPFLPWQSWDWLLNEMADICWDTLHTPREKVSSYEPVDEEFK